MQWYERVGRLRPPESDVLICEVVAVGTELLLGQVVDTNSAWLGERLALIGVDSHYQTRVGDNHARIVAALERALDRSDAVIVCGGLGPTQDDITREAIAAVLGVELRRSEAVADRIRSRSAATGRVMFANSLRQADIPLGARVMDVQPGTAPGLICSVRHSDTAKVIYAVPGVPWEMRRMVSECVLDDLRARAGPRRVIVSRVLRTWGCPEAGLADLLDDEIRRLDSTGEATIAFLAGGWEGMKVRITAKAADADAARRSLSQVEARVRGLIGDVVFGVDDDTMESVVLGLLRSADLTLGLAESVTGGLISARLSGVAGASAVLRGAVVPYHRDLKTSVLGAPDPSDGGGSAGPVGLAEHVTSSQVKDYGGSAGPVGLADADPSRMRRGVDVSGGPGGVPPGAGVSAVSEEMALAMASGVCEVLDCDVGMATTGAAGPDPHEGSEPGTVWIGLWLDGAGQAQRLHLPFDRARVREFATITALDLLRTRLEAR